MQTIIRRLWWPWLVAALMLVTTIVVWAPHLDDRAAWRDEAATMIFASFPPADLWRATGHVDRTMVVYYVLVSPLAQSLTALRAVSLVAGGVSIGVTAWLATRWWGVPAGLVAGMFLLVNPLLSPYLLEARSYTLVTAFFMVATALLMAGTPSGGTWALYGAALTMAILMNMLMAPAVLIHVIHVAVRMRRRARWAPLLAWSTAAGIPVSLLLSSRVTTGQLSWIPPATVESVTALYGSASGGLWFWALVGVLIVVLLGGGRRLSGEPLLGVALVIIPVAANVVVSAVVTPMFYPRYLLLLPFGFALMLAAWAGMARSRRLGGSVVVLAAALAATWTWQAQERPATPHPPPLLVGLADRARVGDSLVIDQTFASTGHIGAIALGLRDESLWEDARRLALDVGPRGRVHARITWIDEGGLRTESAVRPGPGTTWMISVDPLDGCAVVESFTWPPYTVHRQMCTAG